MTLEATGIGSPFFFSLSQCNSLIGTSEFKKRKKKENKKGSPAGRKTKNEKQYACALHGSLRRRQKRGGCAVTSGATRGVTSGAGS
jgi:hypothetical protein